MSMERIYRTNQYARECETVVTEVQEKNGQMIISCEASVFYPEGGGQPSDTGTVTLGSSVFKVISAHPGPCTDSGSGHYTKQGKYGATVRKVLPL